MMKCPPLWYDIVLYSSGKRGTGRSARPRQGGGVGSVCIHYFSEFTTVLLRTPPRRRVAASHRGTKRTKKKMRVAWTVLAGMTSIAVGWPDLSPPNLFMKRNDIKSVRASN